tara:strand:- start:52 stop:1605 length:1554 start_codon:yes stop_codon:yes gene_type:complete
MNTTVSVENSAKFKIELLELENLYFLGSPGRNGTEPEIDSASGFLQRLAQQLMWKINDNQRGKEYLHSLIMGNSLLDAFVLVPAELLKKSVVANVKASDPEEKEAWDVVLKYINERMNNGALFFIIDGQNRLNEILVPFFSNKISLSSKSSLIFNLTDGKKKDVRGLFYKDLPQEVKDYINNIKVPIVTATSGEIEQFSKALIWKNEGIAWDDWQKEIMNQWYTKFRRQISSIASKDDEIGNAPSIEILEKVEGKKYSYDVNGFDRIVAELLVWMDSKTQPTNVTDFSSYFKGVKVIKQSTVKSLKGYLKGISLAYKKHRKIKNTALRNYVMLMFVIDNPKKFKNLNVPNWKIQKPVDFASWYVVINKLLMVEPVTLDELPSKSTYTNKNGDEMPNKNPDSYNWYNSESSPDYLNNRISILLRVLTSHTAMHAGKPICQHLKDENIILELDDTPMPSIEEVFITNPIDTDGNVVPISQLTSKIRGHNFAKSKGGSNTNLTLQNPRGNKQWQEDFVGK